MKRKHIYAYIFALAVILAWNTASAQVFDRKFNSGLKRAHLEFKMPSTFSEKDSTGRQMVCRAGGSIIYTIVNQDSSIIIGFFNFIGTPYTDGRTAVNNILNGKRYYQDTTASKPIVHTAEFAKSAFNADAAVEYSRNCTQTVNGYNNMRIVSIANNKFGEGNIIYFYKDKGKPDFDKFIQGNTAMLRFKSY